MKTYSFHTLDVFTQKVLTGNPLAIVHDADGIEGARMQAIAREFGLPETVFVMAARNPMHTARIRIFTPSRELPFAGHPTVGTAICLAEMRFGTDQANDAILVLEEEVGPVRCAVRIEPGKPSYGEFDVPTLPHDYGKPPSREKLAAALGLLPSDIGSANHKPTCYTAGVPYNFVPVRDRDALHRAHVVSGNWQEAFGRDGAYVYTPVDLSGKHGYRARMFFPLGGIAEDPATGSAAAAFAGVVVRFDGLSDGRHVLPIEQGIEMGRPSLITLEVELAAGRLAGARIGGYAVGFCEGKLTL
jgi:trans-2,3-dihydro-3-hydroxyanthranilate isomerase